MRVRQSNPPPTRASVFFYFSTSTSGTTRTRTRASAVCHGLLASCQHSGVLVPSLSVTSPPTTTRSDVVNDLIEVTCNPKVTVDDEVRPWGGNEIPSPSLCSWLL